ncbi:MAG: phosphate ABC transporter ATP-binding protein [Chloroflexota bacterium]
MQAYSYAVARPAGGVAAVAPPEVSVEDLAVSIDGRPVLRDINVAFAEHGVTAIIGPTGCGKTTLLRSLNRMHDGNPAIKVHGRVTFNGTNIYGDVNVRDVRRRVGMVFQRPNPFPQSIIDNVTIGPRSHGLVPRKQLASLAEAKLTEVGLWAAVKERLGASPFVLSGGQQQLLCLARALSVEPEVLLLDEPTSSLDPGSTQHIEALLAELRQRMIVILVTHNLQQARRVANQVLFLLDGQAVEFTPAYRFFDSPTDERSRRYISGSLN